MRFSLRAASPADVGGLLRLWQEAAENGGRPPDTRQAVLALLSRDREALILAEHDAMLIGSVIAGWDGWRYHLYRLAVRPGWEKAGRRYQRAWPGPVAGPRVQSAGQPAALGQGLQYVMLARKCHT